MFATCVQSIANILPAPNAPLKVVQRIVAAARLTAAQQVEQAQEASGVDGDRRGETLTVEELGALALALKLLR